MADSFDYAIEVVNLVKSYDGVRNAVDDVSFQIRPGEIYGLLGKNGAGKSTTIKTLTTLVPPTSGTATILGMDLRKKSSQIRKIIGVVQQEEAFDFATVERNFRIYGMLWEVPSDKVESRSEELMELFNLKEIRKRRAFELSGGQKKRLQVAREFIHDMQVLFLDEPTAGMDPIMRRSVLDFVMEKAKDGLTVLFTTQILEEADYVCDRIGIMDLGRKVAEGTSSQLKERFGSLKKLVLTTTERIPEESIPRVKEMLAAVPSVTQHEVSEREITVIGKNMGKTVYSILSSLSLLSIEIDQVNLDAPSLDDVFLEVVKK
ncbi:MAG: ABC transporter ATP-binding protein [Candidatus Thermoplasmatota archaeon]|jgi:ABC-2 type transport system ATP-binding protein|nr:ABC transporter ATP-binding protein [Candidatus Thermoplasmatota archaeon]